MATNILRLIHTALILRILLVIVRDETCCKAIVIGEITLTILRAVVERRLSSRRTKIQILISLLLGYLLFPNKLRYLSWLFFLKTI